MAAIPAPKPRKGKRKHPRFSAAKKRKRWQAVRDRDRDQCIYCGQPASEVHHILGRGQGWRDTITWDVKNMACVCPGCHRSAGTREQQAKAFEKMALRYGYTYNNWPFSGVAG